MVVGWAETVQPVLRYTPVEDGPDACTVGAVPVDMQAGGQENAVLHRDGPVGEGCNQELVPTCWWIDRS